jgi:(p)ppGpp synthase/HD superfamily hydrolase
MKIGLPVDPVLTARFERALAWANELFCRTPRKGTSIPYVAHLLSVAALVLEDGGSEDEAIAGLLHDVLEDVGMEKSGEIRHRFGERVEQIVLGCTDSDRRLNEDSWTRKMRAVAHLSEASPEVFRVSLADKLHNARSILRDLEQTGDEVWELFNVPREGQLHYYGLLVDAFRKGGQSWMVNELARTVEQMGRDRKREDDARGKMTQEGR